MKPTRLLSLLLSLSPLTLSAQQVEQRSPQIQKQTPHRVQTAAAHPAPSKVTAYRSQLAWQRGVYRQLDLMQPSNTPLYLELETDGQNLFGFIIQLYLEGKLKVFSYGQGRERLDAAHELSPKQFLERFRIPYSSKQTDTGIRYELAAGDLPSSEVRSYYLKEEHSFDRGTTSYRRQVTLLCPILSSVGDFGAVAMPLFWVRYQDLAPFLSQRPSSLMPGSSLQHASLDDYFTLSCYQGSIIRTDDDPFLLERSKTPEALEANRQRIEQELQRFREQLFIPDSLLRPQPPMKPIRSVRGRH